MPIIREQYKVGQGSGDPLQITPDADITAGSLLLCIINLFENNATKTVTITDNQGNSWIELYGTTYRSSDHAVLAYALNAAAGTTTVSIDPDNDESSYFGAIIIEVSGIKTSGALDQNNENTASSSSWDSGNITTTQADEYLIGGFGHDQGNPSLTEDGAWTLIWEEEDGGSEMPMSVGERIVSSTLTESYSGSIGSSVDYWSAIASFMAETAVTRRVFITHS